MDCYGRFLVINGEKLCVNIEGKGDKTIVLLHGAGIASPVLEMKPLATLLSDQLTVVTLEYFGYGLSDNTKRERTIELIAEEIHCALQSLGVLKYSIMAHSISGVYGLYYTNKYPEEAELIRTLSLKNTTNSNILDELKGSTSNFEKAAGMKFSDIPVLFFLSTDTIKQIKQWRELHEELTEGNSKCKIIVLEGSHFLYNQFAQEIVDMAKEFIGI